MRIKKAVDIGARVCDGSGAAWEAVTSKDLESNEHLPNNKSYLPLGWLAAITDPYQIAATVPRRGNFFFGTEMMMKTSELFEMNGLNFQEFHSPNTYGSNYQHPPKRPGIYLVVGFDGFDPEDRQFIAYVGSSKNLAQRYENHDILKIIRDETYYATFFFKEHNSHYSAENDLVRAIRPPFNSHMYLRQRTKTPAATQEAHTR